MTAIIRSSWAIAAYVATIVAANLAVEFVGIVPVGFGLAAPAAVYFVGLAFTIRDVVHERHGAVGAMVAVLIGALASWLSALAVGGSGMIPGGIVPIAVASAAAFLVSETVDLVVYAPLRERNLPLALAASNVVGLVVDSVIFLGLAFGSTALLAGQVVGKAWMTLAALVVLLGWRRWRPRAEVTA